MATLPQATTKVSRTAGALGSGADLICIWAPVATNPDMKPRQYGSAQAAYNKHGYSEGVEYAALHAQFTGKPFLFVGLPINTPGVISREDTSGNTGTSVSTLAAGSAGVLSEHEGYVRVEVGGTVGTDQIVLGVSMDGGLTVRRVRIGTATSYVIPYFGVTINLAAGTLVQGEVIHTWFGSGPRSDSGDWVTARTNLASMLKLFRSVLLTGDLQNNTEGQAFGGQMVAYETENKRFIYGRVSAYDHKPYAKLGKVSVRMTGNPSVTFAEVGATGDTITRSAGSFITDGFTAGMVITVAGSASNNFTSAATVASVTATVLTLDTDDLVDEGPTADITITGVPSLVFDAVADTVTRSSGSWLDDGFRVSDALTISGTASNDATDVEIQGVTATVLSLPDGLVAEVIGTDVPELSVGQLFTDWMSEIDGIFSPLTGNMRVDMSAGRARITSPFSGYAVRRPLGWFASLREYQHDLHVATWKKALGPIPGADLTDSDSQLAEWDDEFYGNAGVGARFTVARRWPNGPDGMFIGLSLTREEDGLATSQTHNVAVVNEAMTVTQLATENAVGEDLVLNPDNTATKGSLKTIERRVNRKLKAELLRNRGEGARASSAVWTASEDDDFSGPEAVLTGVLVLILKGTIHSVETSVRINPGSE